ncbi:hypothetical protein HC752_05745 [Vibrio sp. S9_S30]|uniref:hypothetical protein n=1 Tax=Vibrio sp. S9_S30 TaxID=2720226 RepID=UPI0016819880|nr:hypothetical protein [Vibrio sp. S9_S30]MBD1556432.1 hypothetical protein [Vibrio sp. S9_S30]
MDSAFETVVLVVQKYDTRGDTGIRDPIAGCYLLFNFDRRNKVEKQGRSALAKRFYDGFSCHLYTFFNKYRFRHA